MPTNPNNTCPLWEKGEVMKKSRSPLEESSSHKARWSSTASNLPEKKRIHWNGDDIVIPSTDPTRGDVIIEPIGYHVDVPVSGGIYHSIFADTKKECDEKAKHLCNGTWRGMPVYRKIDIERIIARIEGGQDA